MHMSRFILIIEKETALPATDCRACELAASNTSLDYEPGPRVLRSPIEPDKHGADTDSIVTRSPFFFLF